MLTQSYREEEEEEEESRSRSVLVLFKPIRYTESKMMNSNKVQENNLILLRALESG